MWLCIVIRAPGLFAVVLPRSMCSRCACRGVRLLLRCTCCPHPSRRSLALPRGRDAAQPQDRRLILDMPMVPTARIRTSTASGRCLKAAWISATLFWNFRSIYATCMVRQGDSVCNSGSIASSVLNRASPNPIKNPIGICRTPVTSPSHAHRLRPFRRTPTSSGPKDGNSFTVTMSRVPTNRPYCV